MGNPDYPAKESRPKREHCRILTYTTLYPGMTQPNHGVFVENRLRHALADNRLEARVLAPVPWFPFSEELFGRYASFARMPARECRDGISIEHPRYPIVPKIGMSITPLFLFLATLPHVRRLLPIWDFDLIDAHYVYPDGVAAVLLGKAVGKPVVITARGTDINYLPRYALPKQMILYAANQAAEMIAVSGALKTAMVDLGIPADRITVLRNGVDLEMFRPGDRVTARASLGVAGRTLLSVGHLIERKGHDIVISALARLPDCTLLIAGEGPERSRLEALARGLGVASRVRMLGVVPHQDLRRLYLASDVLVLASSREGWPNVLLESMACGTPVVASAIWGNPEVVSSPDAGTLMRSRTPEDLAEAVERLFREYPDRDATRAYAERFSWNDTSLGQIRLFERILGRQFAPRPIVTP